MKIVKDFLLGINQYTEAYRFIKEHKLQRYYYYIAAIIPVIGFLFWNILSFLDLNSFTNYLISLAGLGRKEVVGTIVKVVVYLFSLALFFKFFKIIFLVIISPIMAILAEKTIEILSNSKRETGIVTILKDIKRSLILSFSNLFGEFILTCLVFLITILIPILSPFSGIALFVIEAYYIGFSFIDFSNEYYLRSIQESNTLVKKHKGFSIGIGSVFILLILPLVGIIFAPVLSVVAATLGFNKLEK